MTDSARATSTQGKNDLYGVTRIVSGGQTGVDRAALDFALAQKIEHGGWCPKGRLAEDGAIPNQYVLRETESREYRVRTERNVVDSDGTLLLYRYRLSGGTLLTHRFAKEHERPVYRVRLERPGNWLPLIEWLQDTAITTLNVAGPRESSNPGIAEETRLALEALQKACPILE
ncbi:MAG: putative molybdenum carrier protein [Planctomycetota bacterium]